MDQLPLELLLQVFSHLDLKSLCRAAQVCRRWKKLAYDPSLYVDLDLTSYKHCTRNALRRLSKRCKRLRKLNVSRLFNNDLDLEEFMESTGSYLTHLNAAFTKVTALPDCSHLIYLDISDIQDLPISTGGYDNLLACRHLQNLNISGSDISEDELIPVLENNPGLQVLDIGGCYSINDTEIVMETLANHNPSLTVFIIEGMMFADGFHHLARLKDLQCLDISYIMNKLGDSLPKIFKSCKKLTDLRLNTAQMTYNDVTCLAEECTKLDNLQIGAVPAVDKAIAMRFLSNMPQLRDLGIANCSVSAEEVVELRALYPNVDIAHF